MDPSSSNAPPLLGPLNLAYFKNLITDHKTRTNGEPSKKRGPKPDMRPPQNRRQELNRLAQRTHRERKEQYVKALEYEIQTSKAHIAELCAERDAWRSRSISLESSLKSHGISFMPGPTTSGNLNANFFMGGPDIQAFHPQVSSSMSSPLDQVGAEGTVPLTSQASVPLMSQASGSTSSPQEEQLFLQQQQLLQSNGIDYTQFAKDFVKSLEMPCAEHQQMLCTQALDPDGNPCGHVLMATCPPRGHCINQADIQYPHQLPDLSDADLVRLLELDRDLPAGVLEHGEVSPIGAWKIIWANEALHWLSLEDLFTIQDQLMPKVRCFGYGAVLESFEVFDAIENVLSGIEPSASTLG